ncbi:class I SAM-dependent methyltransferase [Acidobacterium sp. S8]|uniref:class I SAM-dependent methyltransferase n=1 Tax=Acidobacterium sp. S8 TaxID=1641854 RepID=UPI00131B0FB0|nr:class I SAM-dependent methyltransferase [Acidobacterium sp. S8]
MKSLETAERFTGRVESYRQYRPRYPAAVVDLLQAECGLNSDSQIADVAAGTGLLTGKFLERGFSTTAIEPNAEMRQVCGQLATQFSQLRCLPGSAEETGLPQHSIDLITVAQAMHWFDFSRARSEFVRILRPRGWCAVVYNERQMSGDAFHDRYEKLLRDFGVDYAKVQRQHLTWERIAAFFAPSPMKRAVFSNAQSLTLEALQGRILSSSYMPKADHPRHREMLAAIADLFDEHQQDSRVQLKYDCTVSYARLS